MAVSATLPTLYEYYTNGGITAGLSVNQSYFTLNNRNITIYSGSMHYFRVPKPYWRDRLRKMRAAGLNAVTTYIPWNLHEPEDGQFEFGQNGTDMADFLDIHQYLKTAQEEDLLAIIRPGPYICSEWEFGGFPSWLLNKSKNIKLRTSDPIYMKYVRRYFNVLLSLLAMLQFTKGGPIIALQVENEYGSTERPNFVPDRHYLRQLRDLMLDNGIVELLVSSDSPTMHSDHGTLPGLLFQTANFADNPENDFNKLKLLQPGKPSMAMEYWSGWFDHWSEKHHTTNINQFRNVLERILKYPASVNMYMFHGGTNWGFLNGANLANGATDNSGYQPDTTSYDYDAPLTENGNYTQKYLIVVDLIRRYNQIKTKLPLPPRQIPTKQYENLTITQQLSFDDLVKQSPHNYNSWDVAPMENFGQNYGYIVYRKHNLTIPSNATLMISGRVCDTVIVRINGNLWSKPLNKIDDLNNFGFWRLENSTLNLGPLNFTTATLDLIVENWGRVNFGSIEQFNQFKGLWQGGVYLNNQQLNNWTIVPLEFKRNWTNSLKYWRNSCNLSIPGPGLYKTIIFIDEPQDTFIDMSDWVKGIVMVNGFVLGRYSRIGPQQSLYWPAPLMQHGNNTIVIFEHYMASHGVRFSTKPIYYNP